MMRIWVGLTWLWNRFVGWVEPRFIEARPTAPVQALGGPHDPEDRSTPPHAAAMPRQGIMSDTAMRPTRAPSSTTGISSPGPKTCNKP